MNLIEKARRRQTVLENLMDDPKIRKHERDFEVFASMVWFDYLADRLAVSDKIKDYITPILRKRSFSPPVFDVDRVSGWLVEYYKVKPHIAAKRVAPRETYHETSRAVYVDKMKAGQK